MKRNVLYLMIFAAVALLTLPPRAEAQEGALPAKPAGVVRIGLVKPKVQVSAGEASQISDTVRSIFAEYLTGPTIEVALLTARVPSQFAEEARQADCDYTLSTELVHRRGGDASALGKALGNFGGYGSYIPGGDAVQSMIVTGVVRTAADYASSVKAKDEMRLEYRLDAPGSAKPLLQKNAKLRAGADGEDLLTPLVEQAAEAVGAAVSKH